TSGTTGKPKGTLVRQEGIVNYSNWRLENYGFDEMDRTLQLLSFAFDGFCSNFYSSLLSGGTLYMNPDSRKFDFRYICDTIRLKGITNTSFVPGMYRALLQNAGKNDLLSLRFIVLAGEKAEAALIKESGQKAPHVELINEYGPTEATVTALSVKGIQENGTALVGSPINNVKVYILDAAMDPVPDNVPGEIWIAGAGVARGYLNRQELHREKFRANPFSPDQTIYRTGDQVKRLTGGKIEFIGRIDNQVKIRGYRIEPGEIEKQITQHKQIENTVVLPKTTENTDPLLCAYIVTTNGDTVDTAELRDYLSWKLPDYMVPTIFVHLPKIPLTPNGKIDKRKLPEPEIKMKDQYVAPRNQTEEILTQIWTEVLKIKKEKIGIYDNFFELGGHSLMATILAAQIHKAFNVNIKLVKMFELSTISQLAQYITKNATGAGETFLTIEPAPKKPYYKLSPAQERMYLQQQMNPETTAYNNVQAVELEGELDKKKLEKSFRAMIERHESLRTSFVTIEDEPRQKIHPFNQFNETHETHGNDGSNEKIRFAIEYGEETGKAPLSEAINNFVRPFDLSKAPLFRVGLIAMAEKKHILMTDIHHIISDGTS
ncbi:MAG: AMP-binding protein, partial [bacterium]|nr:AMP-binding protein [bacterium]